MRYFLQPSMHESDPKTKYGRINTKFNKTLFFLKYHAIAICNNYTHEHPNSKNIAQTTILAITITTTTQTTTLTMMMTTQQQLTRTSKS